MTLADNILITWYEKSCWHLGICDTECRCTQWVTACEDNQVHITTAQAHLLDDAATHHFGVIDAIDKVIAQSTHHADRDHQAVLS